MLGAFLLTGCAQFTTDDQELAQLDRAARDKADAYVSCVISEAEQFLVSSADTAFIVDVARNNCTAALDVYEEAQSEFLDAQYMMYGDKLDESIERADERARNEIARMVLSRQQQAQPAQASTQSTPAPVAAPVTARPASPGGWSADQRVYLDCMEDQALKYMRLDESAEAIAEVAQSRCRSYLGGPNAALEQEGRAVVLGTVFDARLAPSR